MGFVNPLFPLLPSTIGEIRHAGRFRLRSASTWAVWFASRPPPCGCASQPA